VDAIAEMLESEPCPRLLERGDCALPLSIALIACSCLSQLVEQGRVADCTRSAPGRS
jgi:hypothetical protein